jgi:hypothetical protein
MRLAIFLCGLSIAFCGSGVAERKLTRLEIHRRPERFELNAEIAQPPSTVQKTPIAAACFRSESIQPNGFRNVADLPGLWNRPTA